MPRCSFPGLLFLALFALVLPAEAAEDDIPGALAAQLIVKIAAFDKNFAARRQARPRVLVVQRNGDERSVRIATQLATQLAEGERGFPVDTINYAGARALGPEVETRAACIIILATGLEEEMPGIAAALVGRDVLSVATTGTSVERGASVGLEIRSGRPKIVVNLASAQAQHVSFRAELLSLARIVAP